MSKMTYKGGYAILDLTNKPLDLSDSTVYPGTYAIIDKAVKAKKPVYVQNFNVVEDAIAPTSGYVNFFYDSTGEAYLGCMMCSTDFNGENLVFVIIGVDKDNYCVVYGFNGAELTPKATTSKEGVVKKCSKVTDATSETIVTQFNDLLSKMKSAGMMSGS